MTTMTSFSAESPGRTRPITMAILAMGGEGGGVLSEWIVALSEHNDWFAQSTSVPGVAQRTGATVYYVELFPREDSPNPRYPVLSTMPTPGEVDVVVASELMEAGRAIQRGFCTPDRSVLIASTSRTYAMPERTAMGDGRIDSQEIIEAALKASKSFWRGDFARIADETGSVISAVLFGAIAASGTLPFTREQFEDAIRASGKGVDSSLRAFAEGYRVAAASQRPVVELTLGSRPAEVEQAIAAEAALEAEVALAIENPAALVGSKLTQQAQRILSFPAASRHMLVHGIKRTAEYQDVRYADEYLDRVASVAAFETDADGAARLTTETARYTALWMTYEDTIRVAFHKTRARRFDRVGKEARVNAEQMMQVREYLHPQVEEITDTLPTGLGRWVLNSKAANRLIHRVTHKGIKLQTTSVWGYTMLYTMARCRPIRRRSLRFGLEQARIDSWLTVVREYAATNYALACEIVECQQVVKGYGETHARGLHSFNEIMRVLPLIAMRGDAAQQVALLRKAALADEHGKQLAAMITGLTG
jgi:indolepyruvate ferredoxin oxidoreductase beta subunit